MLAGRLRDPALIAHLILIYFDTILVSSVADYLEEEDDIYGDGAELRRCGQAVGKSRAVAAAVEHLLPNVHHVESRNANDHIMMASIGPLLSIMNRKLAGMMLQQAMGKALMAEKWPIAKMVECICFTVDLADKKKNDESFVKDEDRSEVAADGDNMMHSNEGDDGRESSYRVSLVDVNSD